MTEARYLAFLPLLIHLLLFQGGYADRYRCMQRRQCVNCPSTCPSIGDDQCRNKCQLRPCGPYTMLYKCRKCRSALVIYQPGDGEVPNFKLLEPCLTRTKCYRNFTVLSTSGASMPISVPCSVNRCMWKFQRVCHNETCMRQCSPVPTPANNYAKSVSIMLSLSPSPSLSRSLSPSAIFSSSPSTSVSSSGRSVPSMSPSAISTHSHCPSKNPTFTSTLISGGTASVSITSSISPSVSSLLGVSVSKSISPTASISSSRTSVTSVSPSASSSRSYSPTKIPTLTSTRTSSVTASVSTMHSMSSTANSLPSPSITLSSSPMPSVSSSRTSVPSISPSASSSHSHFPSKTPTLSSIPTSSETAPVSITPSVSFSQTMSESLAVSSELETPSSSPKASTTTNFSVFPKEISDSAMDITTEPSPFSKSNPFVNDSVEFAGLNQENGFQFITCTDNLVFLQVPENFIPFKRGTLISNEQPKAEVCANGCTPTFRKVFSIQNASSFQGKTCPSGKQCVLIETTPAFVRDIVSQDFKKLPQFASFIQQPFDLRTSCEAVGQNSQASAFAFSFNFSTRMLVSSNEPSCPELWNEKDPKDLNCRFSTCSADNNCFFCRDKCNAGCLKGVLGQYNPTNFLAWKFERACCHLDYCSVSPSGHGGCALGFLRSMREACYSEEDGSSLKQCILDAWFYYHAAVADGGRLNIEMERKQALYEIETCGYPILLNLRRNFGSYNILAFNIRGNGMNVTVVGTDGYRNSFQDDDKDGYLRISDIRQARRGNNDTVSARDLTTGEKATAVFSFIFNISDSSQ